MTQLKNKWKIPLMLILVFTFSFSSLTLAKPGYKILYYKGKVKVKKGNEMIPLKKHGSIPLEKADSVMVYPGSSIEISFPNGSRNVFQGPFYALVTTLDKPFKKDKLSFFKQQKLWKGIEGIFDEEGNESGGTRTQNSTALYNEAKRTLTDENIEDKTPTAEKSKEMKTALEAVEHMFNAFPEVKQIVIRALVYKDFGMDKKALKTVLAHYEKILYLEDKKPERELIEDYMSNRFLPIVITIRPGDENRSPGKRSGFKMIFSSNIKLWWAAFYFDGKKLKEIEKTIDHSLHPQNKFELRENITIKRKSAKSRFLFVVTSPDWSHLEKFDSIHAAKKELLGNDIKETRSKRIKDYGKVIIKLRL